MMSDKCEPLVLTRLPHINLGLAKVKSYTCTKMGVKSLDLIPQ